ncbi:hypothetical protein SGPA1_12347 [Streptomyces misionensis JCM 4497]
MAGGAGRAGGGPAAVRRGDPAAGRGVPDGHRVDGGDRRPVGQRARPDGLHQASRAGPQRLNRGALGHSLGSVACP